MNKEFVPPKQSLELKELGFDENCFKYYNEETLSTVGLFYTYDNPMDFKCLAPLYRQAFRFFREKYKLYGSYGQTNDDREEVNGFVISNFINGTRNKLFADWEVGTYEEAELACLDKLISILKEQQNGK
jgi:hypothetical protein